MTRPDVNKRKKLNVEKVLQTIIPTPPQPPNLTLTNRYTPLENRKQNKGNENARETPINTKPKTPLPIEIHQKLQNHKNFINFITETIGKQFHVKYTSGRVSIHAYDNVKYKTLLKELTESNLQLHTYTPADEKTHGMVFRELDSGIDEIRKDLTENHKCRARRFTK